MKKILLILLAIHALPAAAHRPLPPGMPDLPPDATSAEYRRHLPSSAVAAVDELSPVLNVGERNLAWLAHINARRAEKLSFTSKETQKAYPIDTPNEYNPEIILRNFAELKASYPAALAAVVFGGQAFTNDPPLAPADYLEWSRKLDRVYQSAARWRTMQPYLDFLAGRRAEDIRGFYYLSRLPERAAKLREFARLPEAERAKIHEALVGMCLNGSFATNRGCESEVGKAERNGADLNARYEQYRGRSEGIYRDYFAIPFSAPRGGFNWEGSAGGPSRLVTPFTDPEKEEVRRFLQDNIEDEWRFGNWELKLPFTTDWGAPYVAFEPGATPNVNRLGGDRITMNANQPLTEYDAQWTIRHEFGHVLGLPDCYVEFYVPEKKVIVNYQIDVENIMCSRRGHVKQENVDELRRAYGRGF